MNTEERIGRVDAENAIDKEDGYLPLQRLSIDFNQWLNIMFLGKVSNRFIVLIRRVPFQSGEVYY